MLPPGLQGIEFASLDGTGNNVANPTWGAAGTNYLRVAPAVYADGRSQQIAGPNARFVSNRVFNDRNQNLFSEQGISQWGFVWGQVLDHTFGIRQSAGGEPNNIPFNANDPIEEFENDLGVVPDTRSVAAPGTGVNNPREQVNLENSYIDAELVYGSSPSRLEWLLEGPVDGNLANNGPHLLLPNGYLPRRDFRGNAAAAPAMDVNGRLTATPNAARVAGDVRANENVALTATQTLLAREHNRIVDQLPTTLSNQERFQIARKVVIATQQFITYREFLPALGVNLPAYPGYQPTVNASLGNEFAATGYRAHSMIHGEAEQEADADRYDNATLDAIEAQGVEIEGRDEGAEELEFVIPLNVAFFNPQLLEQIGLGPVLQGIGGEPEYNNEDMIDNQLRSVLFQIPVPGNEGCLDGPTLPECFDGVIDLGAIDIVRARDHGIPRYNQLRQAFGLAPRNSFTAITGEATDQFPSDPLLTPGNEVNDINSTDHVVLRDITGDTIDDHESDEAEAESIRTTRRTTLAARLRAIYGGNVNNVDAFVGMLAEPHANGSELGELQRAIWTRQFTALRNGDRFYFENQQNTLNTIRNLYGIDYRRTLAQVIVDNSDVDPADIPPNVFFGSGQEKPTTCRVNYRVTTTWPGHFQVDMSITNTGNRPINRWALKWSFANGQTIEGLWNGVVTQTDRKVTVTNAGWNGSIPPGGTQSGIGFNAAVPGNANARPANMTLNTTGCSAG